MTKICIVGASNLINISLITIYTHIFNECGVSYDLIYWDRLGIQENSEASSVFKFTCTIDNRATKIKKIIAYYRYRKYVIRKIKEQKYDVIILWQTTVAYILSDFLMNNYKKRYILNIRDYIAEKIFPCSYLIKKLVKYSLLNTISSDGFRRFLPEGKYELIQSVNEELDYHVENPSQEKKNSKIMIGFVGNCRYFKENFELIDRLGNDSRFELWYCGTNSERIEAYVKTKKYCNVFTSGKFLREETTSLLMKFDLINSAFGADAFDNSTLVPIRLFTALRLHKPVMVSAGSFLGNLVENEKLGVVIDAADPFVGNVIEEFLKSIDQESFIEISNSFMRKAVDNNARFGERLLQVLSCD